MRWDEKWNGDSGGVSIYKAALKLKYNDYWLRDGYIQLTGQTIIAPHWRFYPEPIAALKWVRCMISSRRENYRFPGCGAINIKPPGIVIDMISARLMAKPISATCIRSA